MALNKIVESKIAGFSPYLSVKTCVFGADSFAQQHMFWLRYKKNNFQITLLSVQVIVCSATELNRVQASVSIANNKDANQIVWLRMLVPSLLFTYNKNRFCHHLLKGTCDLHAG